MSYAEAAAAGLANDKGEPVDNVNVSKQEVKEAAEKVESSEHPFARSGPNRALQGLSNLYAKVSTTLSDPYAGGHVLLNVLAGVGVGYVLLHENKQGKLPWWPTGALYATGAFALGAVEFFTVRRLYKKEK